MAEGRVTLITGGASGIGQVTAEKLTAAGDRIVVADINLEAAEAVADALNASGGDAVARSVDVADRDAVTALVEEVESSVGPIGALVNSAGLLQNASTAARMDPTEAERIMKVNYEGTWITNVAVAEKMKARKQGAIVNIGSINSFAVLPIPSYCVSKVAVKHLTEIFACEYGVYGIRVNGVAPTYTITPAIQARIDSGHRDPQKFIESHALKMLVYPNHIADGINFLLSDQAAAITGVTMPIDAGWLANQTYRSYPAEVAGFGE